MREGNEILRRASIFFAEELDPRASAGLEYRCTTYRACKWPARIVARTATDVLVEEKIRELAWAVRPVTGQVQMTPEGLYGRRNWIALLRRQLGLAGTSRGAADRAMRTLGPDHTKFLRKYAAFSLLSTDD